MYYQPVNRQQAALFSAIIFKSLPEVLAIVESHSELLLCPIDYTKHRSPFILTIELAIEVNNLPILQALTKDKEANLVNFKSATFDGDLLNHAIIHAHPFIDLDVLAYILKIYAQFKKHIVLNQRTVSELLDFYPHSKGHIKLLIDNGINIIQFFNAALKNFTTKEQLYFLNSIIEDFIKDYNLTINPEILALIEWKKQHTIFEFDLEESIPKTNNEIHRFIANLESMSIFSAEKIFKKYLDIALDLGIEKLSSNIMHLAKLYKICHRKKLVKYSSLILRHVTSNFDINSRILFASILAAEIGYNNSSELTQAINTILQSMQTNKFIDSSWWILYQCLDLFIKLDLSIPNNFLEKLQSLNLSEKLLIIENLITLDAPLHPLIKSQDQNQHLFLEKRKSFAKKILEQINFEIINNIEKIDIPSLLSQIEKFTNLGYLLPEFIDKIALPLLSKLEIPNITSLNPLHMGSYFILLCQNNKISESFKLVEIIGYGDNNKKCKFIKHLLENALRYFDLDKSQTLRTTVLLALHELLIETHYDNQIKELHYRLVNTCLKHNQQETYKLLKLIVSQQIIDNLNQIAMPSHINNAVKLIDTLIIINDCINKFFPRTKITIFKLCASLTYRVLENFFISIENIDKIKSNERLEVAIKLMEKFSDFYNNDFKKLGNSIILNNPHLQSTLGNFINRIVMYIWANTQESNQLLKQKYLERALEFTFIDPLLNNILVINDARQLLILALATFIVSHKDSSNFMHNLRTNKIIAQTFEQTWHNLNSHSQYRLAHCQAMLATFATLNKPRAKVSHKQSSLAQTFPKSVTFS